MNYLKKFTIKEFQEDFDNLLNCVENGDSFMITSEYGDAVICSYSQEITDEFVRLHQDHEEGC